MTTGFARCSRHSAQGSRFARRVLIHDQADRDVVASQLLRYRDGRGDNWADIIDSLTLHPDARRSVDERVSSLPLQCHRLPDTGGSREERLQLAHLQACFHFTDYLTTLHRLDRAKTRSEAKRVVPRVAELQRSFTADNRRLRGLDPDVPRSSKILPMPSAPLRRRLIGAVGQSSRRPCSICWRRRKGSTP
jgi:hypothetical protein